MSYINRKSVVALFFGLSACTAHNGGSSDPVVSQPVVTSTDQNFVDGRTKVMGGTVSIEQFESLIPGLKASTEPLTFKFDLGSAQAQHDILAVNLQMQNVAGDMITGSKLFTTELSQNILQQTLQWGDANIKSASGGPDLQKIKNQSAKQQKALHDILSIYDADAAKQADIIAQANLQIASDQVRAQITAARKLSGGDQATAMINIIKTNKLDAPRGVDADKQDGVTKYVNAALLVYLQSNQDIYSLAIDDVALQNATADIQVVVGAVQKFGSDYSTAMQKIGQATPDFNDALKRIKTNLTLNDSDASSPDSGAATRTQWIDNAQKYLGILNGKPDADNAFPDLTADNDSYQKLESSSKIMGDAANDISNSMSILVSAAKLLHLDPNTMKTVSQVAQIAEVGCKVVMGYLTGGPLGAAAAGLGGISMLTGGDASAAEDAIINQKLDSILKGQTEIIKLQQQTLKLQMDTLHAVADVALMIQKTQDSLAGIEGQLVSLSQGQTLNLLRKYQNCMTFANVNTFGEAESNYSTVVGKAVQALLGDLGALDSKMSSADDLKTYQGCIGGLRAIYLDAGAMNFVNSLGANMTERMLDENGSLLDVDMQGQVYAPLRNIFEQNPSNPHALTDTDTYAQGLHLPVAAMSMAKQKYDRWTAGSSAQDDEFSDSLKLLDSGFVYTPIVISHVKTILQLVPMLTVLGEDGHWHANDPFKTKDSDKTVLTILKNLMRLVQASIAQEDLIAGEPVLDILYSNFSDYLTEQTRIRTEPNYQVINTFAQSFFRQITDDDIANKNFDCNSKDNLQTAGCLFRRNPYLAKNFVNYFIQRRLIEARKTDVSADDLATKYNDVLVGAPDRVTYNSLDIELAQDNLTTFQLAHIFGQEFVNQCLVSSGTDAAPQRRQFRIGGAILAAPTANEYVKDSIIYSPNMRQLISVEKDLAATLAKMQKPKVNDQQMKAWIANLYSVTP